MGLVRTQDDLRDVARTAAHVVNVEGVKKLNETAPALRGQSQRPWEKADGLAAYLADETLRDIESEIDHAAPSGRRIVGRRTARSLLSRM